MGYDLLSDEEAKEYNLYEEQLQDYKRKCQQCWEDLQRFETKHLHRFVRKAQAAQRANDLPLWVDTMQCFCKITEQFSNFDQCSCADTPELYCERPGNLENRQPEFAFWGDF